MTLDNEKFAELVLIILGGIVIIWAAWDWFRR